MLYQSIISSYLEWNQASGEAEERRKLAKLEEKLDFRAQVNSQLRTPLYHQVYLILRNKILDRVFAVGDLLPSEDETSQTFGVSRITAKRALNELANEGLVVRERGRGTRVVHTVATTPVRANVEGMLENLMAMGLETEITLLDFDYISPSEHVATLLGCRAGDKVQHAVRVRSLDGEPFSFLVTDVPESVGRSYGRDDLATTPLLTLLERTGVVVSRAEQTLSATLADIEVASLLKVELGSPLLRIRRVVFDQNDQPVQYITGLYRPDRYQYRMNLSRVQTYADKTWSPTP
jgi:GntR family transcriptional regulator